MPVMCTPNRDRASEFIFLIVIKAGECNTLSVTSTFISLGTVEQRFGKLYNVSHLLTPAYEAH